MYCRMVVTIKYSVCTYSNSYGPTLSENMFMIAKDVAGGGVKSINSNCLLFSSR